MLVSSGAKRYLLLSIPHHPISQGEPNTLYDKQDTGNNKGGRLAALPCSDQFSCCASRYLPT